VKVRWPVVFGVCFVVAATVLVGSYWDRVDHAGVDARHAAALVDLRSDDVSVRIQGVRALEQVTQDSPGDQPAVTAELSAFVRSVAGSGNCPDRGVARDVQQALDVLMRRTLTSDGATVVDLHGTCLNNARMSKISLVYANLADAHLGRADLSWSVLDGADLTGADLVGADLSYAHVVAARLDQVNLAGANVVGINTNYSR
jgi:uncharacterized protein YjbI with pentapeptide repeats